MADDVPHRAYLALGSNIDAERNLPEAVRLLAEHGRVLAASRVYQTAPVGFADQADFLNAAILLETPLSISELRERVIPAVESALGRLRDPSNPNAPRTIDVDLVLYDRRILHEGSFRLPDPDILARPFVAVPLAELDPEYVHPDTGRTLAEIAASFEGTEASLQPRPDVALGRRSVRAAERNEIDYRSLFDAITADPRYLANLDWGEPHPGHPEGTVRAHIAEGERNLETLRPKLTEKDYWKLKVLIHVHDAFKRDSQRGVPIAHPRSHASLARAFLAAYFDDADLLAVVQHHDEPFALYRRFESRGEYDRDRFEAFLNAIGDWDLFLAFEIIDGCTREKSRAPLRWLFRELAGRVESRFTEGDIIP